MEYHFINPRVELIRAGAALERQVILGNRDPKIFEQIDQIKEQLAANPPEPEAQSDTELAAIAKKIAAYRPEDFTDREQWINALESRWSDLTQEVEEVDSRTDVPDPEIWAEEKTTVTARIANWITG